MGMGVGGVLVDMYVLSAWRSQVAVGSGAVASVTPSYSFAEINQT